jgi:hypothetical protein
MRGPYRKSHCLTKVFLALGVSATGLASANDLDTEALLAKMRSAYRSIKSARFTTEVHRGAFVLACTNYFAAPFEVRCEFSNTGSPIKAGQTIAVTDGTWMYAKLPVTPFEKTAFGLDAFEQKVPGNLESLCFYDWDRQLSTGTGKNMHFSTLRILKNQKWNGRTWTVLEETAKQQNVLCLYYIDPATSLIWRTKVSLLHSQVGAQGAPVDAWIKQLELGAPLPGSIFAPVQRASR